MERRKKDVIKKNTGSISVKFRDPGNVYGGQGAGRKSWSGKCV